MGQNITPIINGPRDGAGRIGIRPGSLPTYGSSNARLFGSAEPYTARMRRVAISLPLAAGGMGGGAAIPRNIPVSHCASDPAYMSSAFLFLRTPMRCVPPGPSGVIRAAAPGGCHGAFGIDVFIIAAIARISPLETAPLIGRQAPIGANTWPALIYDPSADPCGPVASPAHPTDGARRAIQSTARAIGIGSRGRPV